MYLVSRDRNTLFVGKKVGRSKVSQRPFDILPYEIKSAQIDKGL